MKLRGEWLVVCERVIDDALSNNLTLVSCIEQVATLQFPSVHHGFGVAARFRVLGEQPATSTRVDFRLVRASESVPGEEVITEFSTVWEPSTRRNRIGTNFQFLRLQRAETLVFRLDHRVDGDPWERGPECSLDVVQLELSDEQRQQLLAQVAALTGTGARRD